MIELPQTIRPARFDEIEAGSATDNRLQQLATANIVEGYSLMDNNETDKDKRLPFEFYAEINVNNSRLWKVIMALSDELPDVASIVFGYPGATPFYGNYVYKSDLLEEIKIYQREFSKDPFIEWGILISDKNQLIEIYIPDAKFIKFWGVDKDSFQKVMTRLDLFETKNIEYIDEYPIIREPLSKFDILAKPPKKIVEMLFKKYTDSNI